MSAPAISAVVAIAPALTIGFAGRPVPRLEADRVERLTARLRADTREHRLAAEVCRASASTNGFDIDWIVNSALSSPDRDHATARTDHAEGEQLGVGARPVRGCSDGEFALVLPATVASTFSSSAVIGSTARP